jgi:Uma2 family endonuclease
MNDAAPVQSRMTVEAYLAFCDARPRERYQLLAGEPVAMAPATVRHEMIAGNIDATLRPQLRQRGCRSHREIGVARSDDADYLPEPDVVVRCGPVDGSRRWVDDPIAVFEVLSPSTMVDDRGYKLREYFAFPSMRHVVLVYQEQVRVEHWRRGEDGAWQELVVLQFAQDRLELTAAGASISVAEIYDGVAPG